MKLENGGRIEIQGEISGQSEIAAVISTDGGETEAEIQQTALLIDMDIAQTNREMALEVAEMVRISTPGGYILPKATEEILGGIRVGKNLTVDSNGVPSVDTAEGAAADDTRPITAAAVHMEIGNIDALLSGI